MLPATDVPHEGLISPCRRTSRTAAWRPPLALVLEDQGAMGIGQERVHLVLYPVESQGMGTGLGSYCLNAPHPIRFEYFDQPWLPNSHVEMPPCPVEEDEVGNTPKLSPRQLHARARIKRDKHLAIARAEQPPGRAIQIQPVWAGSRTLENVRTT